MELNREEIHRFTDDAGRLHVTRKTLMPHPANIIKRPNHYGHSLLVLASLALWFPRLLIDRLIIPTLKDVAFGVASIFGTVFGIVYRLAHFLFFLVIYLMIALRLGLTGQATGVETTITPQ